MSDVRNYDIGAVILHKYDGGKIKPSLITSHSLLPAEKNYNQIEKQALAINYIAWGKIS